MTSPVLRHAQAAGSPLAIVAAICAAFSSGAVAQSTQDKTLEPVVVTANRTPQIATEVLSDNIVITAEEIARSGQRSLVDLLQRKRSVEIARNGGPGGNSSVFLRGAENKQNVVLVDGVRVGSATSGGANWSAIPLSQIDRIEIVYGPLSSLYGADAVGGVVQIFTKKGEGPATPTAAAGIGSYGTRNLEAGVSGSSDAFRYSLRASHESSNGFSSAKPGAFGYNPDRDGYDRDGVSGQVAYEVAKGHELGVTFLRSRLDSQYDNSATFDDRIISNLASYAVFSRNRFTSDWNSHFQVSRSLDKSNNQSTSPSRFDTRQTGISWQNDVSIGKTDVIQFIAEHRREEVDSTQAALNRERTTNSVAAAYQLKRGAHLASVSVRNDDNSQFGSETTGSVAYGYRITNALRANVSYGTSFRAPTFNELYFPGFGFPDNQPEKGKNAEAGMYYDNGKSQLSAVYYRNRVTDLIVTARPCPVNPAVYTFGCAYNVNKALLTGWTFGGSTNAGNLTYRASLDLQNPEDETTGRRLARRARKHGTVAVEYAAGAAHAGAEVVFSGKRFDDAANRTRLGGYGLFNLYASYDVAPNWSVFGRWDNVFDKNYELARNYATEGSSVFVGVRYGFR